MSFLRHAMERGAGLDRTLPFLSKLLLAVGCLVVPLGSAQAQTSVTLAWSASTDKSVVGYRLYQGGASTVYTNVVDLGNTTNYQFTGLSIGATYFFAVTAYNSVALESPFSNEISYTVPSIFPAPAISVTLAWSASTDKSVVGYRLYQGGASKVYTNVVDVGNTTNYQFTALSIGATYFFAVTAYNSVGLESPFSNEISYAVPSIFPASAISVAAGSGTITAPFRLANNVVSQTVLTGVTNGGRATFSFTITNAGTYTVSALVSAPSQGANSFYVNVDAEPTDPTMIWDIHPLTSGLASRTVTWRGKGTDTAPQYEPAVFNLSAGPHQLVVRGRAANTQLGNITLTPYLRITNSPVLAGGSRSIRGTGVANAKYVLEATSSLTAPSWTPVSTNTSDAQGAFNCTDPSATNYSHRFYRIQVQ